LIGPDPWQPDLATWKTAASDAQRRGYLPETENPRVTRAWIGARRVGKEQRPGSGYGDSTNLAFPGASVELYRYEIVRRRYRAPF